MWIYLSLRFEKFWRKNHLCTRQPPIWSSSTIPPKELWVETKAPGLCTNGKSTRPEYICMIFWEKIWNLRITKSWPSTSVFTIQISLTKSLSEYHICQISYSCIFGNSLILGLPVILVEDTMDIGQNLWGNFDICIYYLTIHILLLYSKVLK